MQIVLRRLEDVNLVAWMTWFIKTNRKLSWEMSIACVDTTSRRRLLIAPADRKVNCDRDEGKRDVQRKRGPWEGCATRCNPDCARWTTGGGVYAAPLGWRTSPLAATSPTLPSFPGVPSCLKAKQPPRVLEVHSSPNRMTRRLVGQKFLRHAFR